MAAEGSKEEAVEAYGAEEGTGTMQRLVSLAVRGKANCATVLFAAIFAFSPSPGAWGEGGV